MSSQRKNYVSLKSENGAKASENGAKESLRDRGHANSCTITAGAAAAASRGARRRAAAGSGGSTSTAASDGSTGNAMARGAARLRNLVDGCLEARRVSDLISSALEAGDDVLPV